MSRPRWAAVGTLALLAYLYLPDPLFFWAAAIVVCVSGWAYAAHLYEDQIRVEAERIHLVLEVADLRLKMEKQALDALAEQSRLVFENQTLRIDLQHAHEDYESTLTRLSEVLDEHSLCPSPVEVVEQVPGLVEHTEQALHMIAEPIIVEASNVTAFPTQRKGGRS